MPQLLNSYIFFYTNETNGVKGVNISLSNKSGKMIFVHWCFAKENIDNSLTLLASG